jgi:hypothetical protein
MGIARRTGVGVEIISKPGGRSEYAGVVAGTAAGGDLAGSLAGAGDGLTNTALLKSKFELEVFGVIERFECR